MVFHISPISHKLAEEISPHLADRLFRREAGEQVPAREITKAQFSNHAIEMQNVRFCDLPGTAESLVPNAAISNLRASRAAIDVGEFRLEFDMVVPMNSLTMDLVEKFYKATVYLTMEPVQREIQYGSDETESLQEAADDAPPVKRGRKRKGATVTISADGMEPVTVTAEELREAARG